MHRTRPEEVMPLASADLWARAPRGQVQVACVVWYQRKSPGAPKLEAGKIGVGIKEASRTSPRRRGR
jgi:hypothetical protein